MAHHNNTPATVLNAPKLTVVRCCPRRKCRLPEGHDGWAHGTYWVSPGNRAQRRQNRRAR